MDLGFRIYDNKIDHWDYFSLQHFCYHVPSDLAGKEQMFTGCEDCRGSLIYQGDTVKLDGELFVVGYSEGAFCLVPRGQKADEGNRLFYFGMFGRCEVVLPPVSENPLNGNRSDKNSVL